MGYSRQASTVKYDLLKKHRLQNYYVTPLIKQINYLTVIYTHYG